MEKEEASLKGQFLISENTLIDPNFYKTVVLVVEHNSDGALGIVINRPIENDLTDVLLDLKVDNLPSIPLNWGGPVHETLLFLLHKGIPREFRSASAIDVSPSFVFEPDFNAILPFIKEHPKLINKSVKLFPFAGCAGWGPGQLEEEMKKDLWIPLDFNLDLLLHKKRRKIWEEALKLKGGLYAIMAITGFKPSMN